MFLSVSTGAVSHPGFPRMRGDVPALASGMALVPWFSPHARGCSVARRVGAFQESVFPACAGMFRPLVSSMPTPVGFPRMRGDVPPQAFIIVSRIGFSPHARGCSGTTAGLAVLLDVFPACAGMFLPNEPESRRAQGFPRMRGDVPRNTRRRKAERKFSPHARGCSCAVDLPQQ